MEADVLVVGAGVLGLACGAELAGRGRSVLVLERHSGPGRETSSRNSEVVHAGLYYPPDSMKARYCVEGRRLLYERCAREGVPHRRLGKLIVATGPDEIPRLEEIRARGTCNGAGDLEVIDGRELARLEPRVRAVAALRSPESGVVDGHALMSSYQAELESRGSTLICRTRVVGLERGRATWRADTESEDGERFSVEVGAVVNAAGLESDAIAALAGLDVDGLGYRLHPCKGDYFAVAPGLGTLTRHLVYPVPVPGGLGIHVTPDLGGRYRLGPDVEWVDAPRYDVDPAKADRFASAVGRYLPELTAADLAPDFAGVRPKLQRPGEAFRDFVVEEASGHGAPGLVNLIGIESPGLTAAGAIAREVARLI